MSSGLFCGPTTKAGKRYLYRMAGVMVFYMLTVFRVTSMVRAHHPTGVKAYLMAALPTIPVIAMLGVVGLYLQEEQDEFQRVLVVRSLLWAIAVSLGMTAFTDFLRSYDAITSVPPFTQFVVFWVVFGVAQGVQSTIYRVREQ